MESLHSDVVRIILGLTSPTDVKNFSMTSKRNLRWLTDKQVWADFCTLNTQFSFEVFLELVAGREEAILASHLEDPDQKYPYNPTSLHKPLVIGGNRSSHVYFVMRMNHLCMYQFRRGHGRLVCHGEPTLSGSAYCRTCIRKRNL